jgi:hypothetical protein
MPVAYVFEAAGATREVYDGLMAALDRGDIDSAMPEGVIAHLAGPTDAGWRVIDVWESEDAAAAFYGSESFQAMLAQAPAIDRTPWHLYRAEVEQTLRTVAATA